VTPPRIRRLPLPALLLLLAAPALAAPDLGVRFISRSPLDWRYNVQYPDGVPQLAPTHDGQDPNLDKHWPAPGEVVTFTAHVRNHGSSSVSGFNYRWSIDGRAQSRTDLTYNRAVPPGGEAAVSLAWRWPADLADHKVRIVVDPANRIGDRLRQNNTYEDFTNALSFSIWVEEGLYDRFNARVNGFGTRSFEDWFRWQFDAMKRDFARSIYPGIAPNGILERIRVEEINVIPFDPQNLDNWRQVLDADPHILLNDGRWQFTSEAGTLADKQKDWDRYVEQYAGTIDWGLIHELSHQLGAIDEYRMNVDQPSQNPVSGTRHDFHAPGLMGGGYVAPGYDGTYYDSHTAGFLNLNLHFRRGFYGEFLFDTPRRTFLRILDGTGAPLAGAEVSAYQKDLATEAIPTVPTFTGRTDANGVMALPNRPVRGVTTATGHTLRPNPFGQINVVGPNGTMLLKLSKWGQDDYRWLELIQLNEAFWHGQRQRATIEMRASLFPSRPIAPENLALHRPAAAGSNPGQAANADDGDTAGSTATWTPQPPDAGQWWQVDLGAAHEIARVAIYSSAGNPHDWYAAFHLEVSPTGAFAGEQAKIPLETNWDETRVHADYGMQRLSGFVDHCVYTFRPATGRYVRLVSDVHQDFVQLQEVQVFGLAP
jgi:hypothetical protein